MPQAIRVVDRLADQADVNISSPANGQVLTYNGSQWENQAAAGGGGSTVYTTAYSTGNDPVSPTNGSWWYPSNGGGIYAARIAGAWVWFYKGFPITLPPTTGWAWNNQRSSTVSAAGGTLYLHAPADGADSWSMYLRTLPATPYSLVFYLEPIMALLNYMGAGIPLRKASDGSWIGFVEYMNSGTIRHSVATGNSSNIISAATYELNAAVKIWNWLKVTDDGTNRKYYYGDDGQNWEQLYSHAHTAITTPDTYGLALESRSGAPVGLRCVSLAEYNSVI